MIKPWIFEFFPASGNRAYDADPEAVAAHFAGKMAATDTISGGATTHHHAVGRDHRRSP